MSLKGLEYPKKKCWIDEEEGGGYQIINISLLM